MLPTARFTKADGNTGAVKPSQTGVLAIIAAAAIGTANLPSSFTRKSDALGAFGLGPLVEIGAYYMSEAGLPVLLIKPTTSTAAAYGAIDVSKVTGTSVVTEHTASAPLDDYDVLFVVVAGGTIGAAGITFKYTLDGGYTWSPVTALGTVNNITLNVPVTSASSGVRFDFAAGTLIAGDTVACTTTRAQMNNADLLTALEALRTTQAPWDAVLVEADATSQMIGTLDAWLAGLEAIGKFKEGYMNTRHKNLPVPGTESEATFLAAMATLVGTTATIRIDVGSDFADSASLITGIVQRRPASMFVAARTQRQQVGVDPAWYQLGPLGNCQITDANSNPKWHNEELFQGLDDLRLTTLRTFDSDPGVYICNARVLSGGGSDYVFHQHMRVMNAACAAAYQDMKKRLSQSVRKQKPTQSGAVYIFEADAVSIETSSTAAAKNSVGESNFVDLAVVLSRTDDISSNAGAFVNADVQLEVLAYIKGIAVTTKFVKSIQIPVAA